MGKLNQFELISINLDKKSTSLLRIIGRRIGSYSMSCPNRFKEYILTRKKGAMMMRYCSDDNDNGRTMLSVFNTISLNNIL